MTAHQLANLLLAGPNNEVFLCPNVQPVDGVEQCPGGEWLDAYIVLHSACRYPEGHGGD